MVHPNKINVSIIDSLITDHGGNEETYHYVWNNTDIEAYLVYGSCSQSNGLFCITNSPYEACFENAVKADDVFNAIKNLNFN